jgi:hypothetical protein
MNKTLHIIRKDLRACAWWLVIWTGFCLLHFGLRVHQLGFGDHPVDSGFWSHLETTNRWDWLAVRWLPLLIIPFFMHADPLVKRVAFWKSLPIRRERLIVAKLAIILAFFVLLPFTCEFLYARMAGLSPLMSEVLASWALRFLPLVAVVTLACFLTPGMLWGLPVSALLYFLVIQSGMTRPRGIPPLEPGPTPPLFSTQPQGCRILVDAESGKAEAVTVMTRDEATRKARYYEATHFSVDITTESLPEDVLVGSVSCEFKDMEIPRQVIPLNQTELGRSGDQQTGVPIQETSMPVNPNGLYDLRNPSRRWNFKCYSNMSSRVIPVEGGTLKGMASVMLVKKSILNTMDFSSTHVWKSGLQRYSMEPSRSGLSDVLGFTTSYYQPLTGANPQDHRFEIVPMTGSYFTNERTANGPAGSIAWITHKSLPYARLLNTPQQARQINDDTRCRSLSVENWSLSTSEQLSPRQAPLAKLRFHEEQSGPENWQIEFVRYETVCRIEIPFSVHISRPQTIPDLKQSENVEDLSALPPPFESRLGSVPLPAHPSEADSRTAFAAITELCTGFHGDLNRHDHVLLPLLERLAEAHPEILFEELKRAADRAKAADSSNRHLGYSDGLSDYTQDSHLWQDKVPGLGNYWGKVIRVLIAKSKPGQKELFLRYHSPIIDLVDAIEIHHWEDDALPLMRGIAMHEPVPFGWREYFRIYPCRQSSEAMLRQIRMGAMDYGRMLDCIDSGLVDGPSAANAAWDATVEGATQLPEVRGAFLLAVKYGVESAPRDLLRIMKSSLLTPGPESSMTSRRFLLSMEQALSVHSDCPYKLAEATAWLEANAFSLSWNPLSRKYERAGTPPGTPWTEPDPSIGRWIDPQGVGTFDIQGRDIRMTSRVENTYIGDIIFQRPIARMMKDITGDFTAEVTVDFRFQLSPPWNGEDRDIFESGGLIAEAGRYNFLGISKDFSGRPGTPEICEQFRRVTHFESTPYKNPVWDPSMPVELRLCRHGDWFYTAWHQGDGGWNEFPAQYNAGWGDTIRVGPYICNRVIQPLEVKYTNYNIRTGSKPPRFPIMGKLVAATARPTPDGTRLEPWGVVRNPLNAGEFRLKGSKLIIRSAPKVGQWNIESRIGAPAVLQPVSGDFTYEVTVGPSPEGVWSSAVVVLCDPSKNFSYKVGNGTLEKKDHQWLNQLAWSNGYFCGVSGPDYQIDHTKPLRIRLQRTDGLLRVSTRQAGDANWSEIAPRTLRRWPKDLEIGVAAVNAGAEDSILEFENPVLRQESSQTSR